MSPISIALDPRHGMHEPTTATPARVANSVRRTTSVDMLRPDGTMGDLLLEGRGRDVWTGPGGELAILDEAAMHAVVDFNHGQLMTALSVEPAADTAALIGRGAGPGFRSALNTSFPDDLAQATPLFLLLDDVPVTVLISGHVLGAERETNQHYRLIGDQLREQSLKKANLCAGWVEGGTIMVELRTRGAGPSVTGPAAPELAVEDPDGWHPMPELPISAMRRRRRLDVHAEGHELVVAAMFRDSYVRLDGVETIIHEYNVDARVERDGGAILDILSTPRVLPWGECPAAAKSSDRLVGMKVSELRSFVRKNFLGPSTCTHLNDAIRSLEDVTRLARHLS
ncbi:MAG: hypothetical protein JWO63_2501 [Frankiales bacterium]|nr:hypothetical protein [Frankiales bacterium]